jgi:hypothetical protein
VVGTAAQGAPVASLGEAQPAELFLVGRRRAAAVIRTDGGRRARPEVVRHVLSVLDHTGRRDDVVGRPDPLVVQPASDLRTRTGTTCG